ncbi:MAG TPA: sigma-70 family RNA polymerase sigma factor [Thermoanaerobaculia bacterium]
MDAPAQATDAESLVAVLESTRPYLRRLLARYGIPRFDWEDLLQDAFVAMLVKGDEIRDTRRWLIGTIRFLCYGYRRRPIQKRVARVDPDMLEDLAPPRPPAQERQELFLDIASLAAVLPVRQRRLLNLRYGLGMTNDEVARSIGCSVSHARKLTLHTLDQVKRGIGKGGGPPFKRGDPPPPPAGSRSPRGRPASASTASPAPCPK